MEQFKEGDLVEAVEGENIVRGRLSTDACSGDLYMHGWAIKPLLRDGYTLTLIDRPKPKVELPTEPGVYIDKDGDPWPFKSQSLDPKWAPYTRVEPVPVTAKRVFERIESVYGEDYFHNSNESWNLVAREFGVTND